MSKRGIGGPYCITSGCIDPNLLAQADQIRPAGEGLAYWIPENCCLASRTLLYMDPPSIEATLPPFEARVELQLVQERAYPPPADGNRSLLFEFEVGSDLITFGAEMRHVNPGEGPGITRASLVFWEDSARVIATVGTTFQVWYGARIGSGVVVTDDSA